MLGILAFVEGFIASAPTIISAGVDIASLLAKAYGAISELLQGGAITQEQADALRAQTKDLEGQWAEVLAAARSEAGKI